jgi:hypothetical protein
MRNRAKCRKCKEVIESFYLNDYVACKCGEISVEGGNMHYKASAIDWKNFIRVDDEDNEIEITLQEKEVSQEPPEKPFNLKKPQLIEMLHEMSKSFENLPANATSAPATNADMAAMLMILTEIFKSE